VAIPAGLAKYQPAVISLACAMQVKPVSSTSILISYATVTGIATTKVVSAVTTTTAAAYKPGVYFQVAGGTFNAAGAGVAQWGNDGHCLFAGLDGTWYAIIAQNAALAVDASSGYLKDVPGDRIAVIYSQNLGPKDIVRVYFVNSQQVPSDSQPLICVAPPATGGYTLSCSVTNSDGLVISNLIGDINWLGTNYSLLQMSAAPASALDQTLFGAATITINNRS
jgi:hypothetical protein